MALFLQVAELAEGLAGEASRLKKRAAIAAAIGGVAGESVEDAGLLAMYVAGMPFAEADTRKLSAGGALLSKALLAVSGASEADLGAAYRRFGDLGAAGFELMRGTRYEVPGAREDGLTLGDVAAVFAGMAEARTTAVRLGLVEGLLRRAGPLEVKYLLKLMLGDMRIGVKQSLVEEAIAVSASSFLAGMGVQPTLSTGSGQALSDEAGKDGPPNLTSGLVSSATVTAAEVRHAVMLEADLAGAVRRAFGGTLGEARMRLFHPLGFMLASPVETADEAVARFAETPETEGERAVVEAFLEDKYDGMRAQVHCGDASRAGRVAIYSRNKEDVTESFPELAEAFARATAGVGFGEAGGVVFDGEILAWDFGVGRALPFAVLGQRIGRKKVSNEMRRAVPVVFMAFDLMVVGGELLLELPLRERRNRLEAVVERLVGLVVSAVEVPEVGKVARRKKVLVGQGEMFGEIGLPTSFDGAERDEAPGGFRLTGRGEAVTDGAIGVLGAGMGEHPTLSDGAGEDGPPSFVGVARLMISPCRLVESAEDIERAYAEARARANEGVMLKAAGSIYQPGRRGLAWVKLKRELATLDVVVTGAEFGHGRRAGILSDYTFAVRAGSLKGEDGELRNVGKAYSGLTDAQILEMSAWMMAHTLEDEGHFRTVEPLMVLEVAFNNIMRSGRHASGFALRFPRIVRTRVDKPVGEIDTVERVEEIYQSQVDRPVE